MNADSDQPKVPVAALQMRDSRLLAQRAIEALRNLDEAGPRRAEEIAHFHELLETSGLGHLTSPSRSKSSAFRRLVGARSTSLLRTIYRRLPLNPATKRRLARRLGANRWMRGPQ